MGLGIKLPLSAAAEEQINSWMPQCYYRDDYPREGCTLVVGVEKEKFHMAVHAPNGKFLESYSADANKVGEYIMAWMSGKVPGRKSDAVIEPQ